MSPMDSALEVVGLRDAHVISVDEPLLIPVYLEPTEGSPLGQEMGSSGVRLCFCSSGVRLCFCFRRQHVRTKNKVGHHPHADTIPTLMAS